MFSWRARREEPRPRGGARGCAGGWAFPPAGAGGATGATDAIDGSLTPFGAPARQQGQPELSHRQAQALGLLRISCSLLFTSRIPASTETAPVQMGPKT